MVQEEPVPGSPLGPSMAACRIEDGGLVAAVAAVEHDLLAGGVQGLQQASAGREREQRLQVGIGAEGEIVVAVVDDGAAGDLVGRPEGSGVHPDDVAERSDGLDVAVAGEDGVYAVAADEGIDAGAAGHDVVAVAAVQRVVALPAEDDVVAGAARERVVAGTAVDVVVAGAADDRVVAGTAVDHVVAAAAEDVVVAFAAVDVVVAGAADDRVVALPAEDRQRLRDAGVGDDLVVAIRGRR